MRLPDIPWSNWKPKLFELLPHYNRTHFSADLIAGITVGFVALPLAMAFAIASGVTPQAGIYTAILGGFIVSLLGGSRLQIGGTTGAFVVIVSGIIAKHGLSGLLMVTMMAGVLLVLLGITGLGNAVKFIPRPVVLGFTNGIALLIASTQFKDFLGLKTGANPSEFFGRLKMLAENLGNIDGTTVALSLVSLAVVVLMPRITPRVPGSIAVLILGTAAVALWHLPVETIGSKFGGITSGFPAFSLPAFRPDLILPLFPSALTVAILAAVESLLSAVVADSLSGDRHNSSAELMAQGIANIVVPLVGGIPVTGAIARTGTNFRSGAKSPLSGIIHAITLLCIVLVFAPLARFVPLATLAAILLVVAYNIGEWREIGGILSLDAAPKFVWFVTFALTVVADLTVAVEVGMALAALLYIKRVAETTSVNLVNPAFIEETREHVLQDQVIPPYVSILGIHGPFLFGATEKLIEETADLSKFAPIVILRLRHMTAIDSTGLHTFETLAKRLERSGRKMLLCGARHQPRELLERSAFAVAFGKENILPNVQAALGRAQAVHEGATT